MRESQFDELCGLWRTVWVMTNCVGYDELCGLWQTVWVMTNCVGYDELCGLWQTVRVMTNCCFISDMSPLTKQYRYRNLMNRQVCILTHLNHLQAVNLLKYLTCLCITTVLRMELVPWNRRLWRPLLKVSVNGAQHHEYMSGTTFVQCSFENCSLISCESLISHFIIDVSKEPVGLKRTEIQ